MDGRELTTNCR